MTPTDGHKKFVAKGTPVRQPVDADSRRRRASRATRVPSRGARLRERDLDLLLALAKMRLLRTTDLTRLFFGARGTCQKRVRKLFDAGLVRAVVTDLAAENRYALTKLGHALLEQALDTGQVPPFRAQPRLEGRSARHLDLLNGYRVALALGVAECRRELKDFMPDWELRAMDPQAALVPDALVVLGGGDADLTYALEVDTGTEAVGIVLRKLERYRERHALRQPLFGFLPRAVAILTGTERRARTLARSVARLQVGQQSPSVLFAAGPGIFVDGGLTGGLAYASDLVAEREAGASPFRRGLLERAV